LKTDRLGLKPTIKVAGIPIIFIYSENIYMDPEPQKLMGLLSILSNLSIWRQIISKIQKCPKPVKATLDVGGSRILSNIIFQL